MSEYSQLLDLETGVEVNINDLNYFSIERFKKYA